jgi:GNAT superfamily N-acetyltransferase
MQITLLSVTDDARIVAFIQLLEPELSTDTIHTRLVEMVAQGYACVGVFDDDVLLGIAGFSTRTHCFSGRVMFVENVVFLPEARGLGMGESLMAWLEGRARALGCTMLTLDAYACNVRARSFYTRLGYDPRGVHFVKELPLR